MFEVIKAFGYTGFGIFLGLVYARHGWKKYYEGSRKNGQDETSGNRVRGIR